MGLTRISSLVLGGWEIEHPSPEYFLPPVQVPISEFFCKFFKSGLRFPNGTLKSLKVYDPNHGRTIWPSSSYSKADMWSFGQKECSVPWLLVLPSRRVVRKRLVLDQIPILWKVKCTGEREEMDSRLEHLWSFYLSSLFQLSWMEVWVFSFFYCSCSSFF